MNQHNQPRIHINLHRRVNDPTYQAMLERGERLSPASIRRKVKFLGPDGEPLPETEQDARWEKVGPTEEDVDAYFQEIFRKAKASKEGS